MYALLIDVGISHSTHPNNILRTASIYFFMKDVAHGSKNPYGYSRTYLERPLHWPQNVTGPVILKCRSF